jgi:hypothetical protein
MKGDGMKRDTSSTLIEELLEDFRREPARPSARPRTGLAEVIDDRHPSLLGRVRVRWPEGEAWVPTLRGLAVRTGDRVVVQALGASEEAVVMGVLDGYEDRPAPARRAAAVLDLRPDEALVVHGHRGRPLLEIREGATGPVVRLLRRDVGIEVDGELRFDAASIRLCAREGDVDVDARKDVNVRGEIIHLN